METGIIPSSSLLDTAVWSPSDKTVKIKSATDSAKQPKRNKLIFFEETSDRALTPSDSDNNLRHLSSLAAVLNERFADMPLFPACSSTHPKRPQNLISWILFRCLFFQRLDSICAHVSTYIF